MVRFLLPQLREISVTVTQRVYAPSRQISGHWGFESLISHPRQRLNLSRYRIEFVPIKGATKDRERHLVVYKLPARVGESGENFLFAGRTQSVRSVEDQISILLTVASERSAAR
jgi:hypothetical protein